MIGEPAGELEHRFGGHIGPGHEFGRTPPADFDTRKQIGLGTRQLIQPLRLEMQLGPENLGIGGKGDGGAAPVLHRPQFLQRAKCYPARKTLAVELLVARNLDNRVRRQRVDHADPDAVQPARRCIGLPLKLAARMERRQDHLQRRFARKFGVRIHGDTPAIIGNGQPVARLERNLDAAGVPCDGLIHRIIEHLGGKMMERALIRPAYIHARAAAHRLQPFQHFDGGGVIGAGDGIGGGEQIIGHAPCYTGRRVGRATRPLYPHAINA